MSHQARPEPVFRQMVAAGPLQPSCQGEYAFRRTGFGDDGHIGKDAVSPSEEPGEPQSDNREETITASSSVFYKSDHV